VWCRGRSLGRKGTGGRGGLRWLRGGVRFWELQLCSSRVEHHHSHPHPTTRPSPLPPSPPHLHLHLPPPFSSSPHHHPLRDGSLRTSPPNIILTMPHRPNIMLPIHSMKRIQRWHIPRHTHNRNATTTIRAAAAEIVVVVFVEVLVDEEKERVGVWGEYGEDGVEDVV
jgi:hypothetical protein